MNIESILYFGSHKAGKRARLVISHYGSLEEVAKLPSYMELFRIKGVGWKTVVEITELLHANNLKWSESLDEEEIARRIASPGISAERYYAMLVYQIEAAQITIDKYQKHIKRRKNDIDKLFRRLEQLESENLCDDKLLRIFAEIKAAHIRSASKESLIEE